MALQPVQRAGLTLLVEVLALALSTLSWWVAGGVALMGFGLFFWPFLRRIRLSVVPKEGHGAPAREDSGTAVLPPQSLRIDVDGYLEPTGKWIDDDWRLHLWFDFSGLPLGVTAPRKWERIKYTVNVCGADVVVKTGEDDFDVTPSESGFRHSVEPVIVVPAHIGAIAASQVGHLMSPSVTVKLHVVKTPFGNTHDAERTFFIRIMNAPSEVVGWAGKNDLIAGPMAVPVDPSPSLQSAAPAPQPDAPRPAQDIIDEIKARFECRLKECARLRKKVEVAREQLAKVTSESQAIVARYLDEADLWWGRFRDNISPDLRAALNDEALKCYPWHDMGGTRPTDLEGWDKRLHALDDVSSCLASFIDSPQTHWRRIPFQGFKGPCP